MSVLVSTVRKKGWTLAAAFLGLALMGVVDYVTGPDLFFSFFYLLPVALVGWVFGFAPGVFFSLLCTMVVLATDLQFDSANLHNKIVYWNTALRTSFYLVFCLMMYYVRKEFLKEYHQAHLDSLTGLFNARAFYEKFNADSLAGEFRPPFSVAYLDLDNFKKVNDRYGHEAGDQLLKLITETLRESVRAGDVAARLGGDEFAIAFPGTDSGAAQGQMEKLQKNLLRATRRKSLPVTFSIGIVTCEVPPDSISAVVRAADKLMYLVKKKGKNGLRALVLPRKAPGWERRKGVQPDKKGRAKRSSAR